jgi:hypothetical protein
MEASFRFGMAILVSEKDFSGSGEEKVLVFGKAGCRAGFREIAKETYREFIYIERGLSLCIEGDHSRNFGVETCYCLFLFMLS